MQAAEQIELIDELLGLRREKSAFLDESVTTSPVRRYDDPEIFAAEQENIFRRRPMSVAHASELAEDGGFLTVEVAGAPVLVTRDRDGEVHGFLNVCRHRGMRLVDAEAGCKHRFTCPYHAWTWDNRGRLIGVPHEAQGFPDLDREARGLKRVAAAEKFGFIWVSLDAEMDIDAWLEPLAEDLAWLDLENHVVHAIDETEYKANWKIIVEGGLEAYHFRVAHAKTIAGLFHDNLSTYQTKGPHMRSVLARSSVDELVERPRGEWRIRDYANLLYTVFPNLTLLAQADHVAVVQSQPLAADRTKIRLTTLVPKADATEERAEWWERNHGFTRKTLAEDFVIGEAVQAGLAHGANEELTFGRFEGALHAFNETVEAHLA